MVYVDVPVQLLRRDTLRAALRGSSPAMTAAAAMSVLANRAVDLPVRDDLLEETAGAEDVADSVRAAALRALGAVAPDRAVALARDLRDPGERLALAAVSTLGRLGGPDDLATVSTLGRLGGPDDLAAVSTLGRLGGPDDLAVVERAGRDASPLLDARATFARTMLVHRFGLAEQVEPPPADLLSEPGPAGTAFASTPTGALRASTVLAAVRADLPEVSGDTHDVLDIACRDRVLHLVVRRDLADPGARRELLGAPAVLGAVATRDDEFDTVSVALVVLSRPTAPDAFALTVARMTGEPVHAGTARLMPDGDLAADLLAVRHPGAPACRIRALASGSGVEVFGRTGRTAVEPRRTPERRPEGDPSSTPPA